MVLPQLQHEGWISPGYVAWGLVREITQQPTQYQAGIGARQGSTRTKGPIVTHDSMRGGTSTWGNALTPGHPTWSIKTDDRESSRLLLVELL
jgi:hypothetical protein